MIPAQDHSESTELISFERLLADISSTFVNISLNKIDQAVYEALKRVSEFLRVDRAAISEYIGNDQWEIIQVWNAPDLRARFSVGDTYNSNDYPWIMPKILRGQTVYVPSVKNLPNSQRRAKKYYNKFGIKSELDIPLKVSDTVLGEIVFIAEREEINWHRSVIRRCNLIGYIFAGVILRKRSDTQLRKAEQLYRTVANFTYDWEYWITPEGSFQYVSPSCLQVTGYTQDNFLKNSNLIKEIIFHEDHKIWREHHCGSSAEGAFPGLQFRIRRRDGTICWIEHMCRQVKDDSGEDLGIRANNRDITKRKITENNLKQALFEIKELKDRLQVENVYLRSEIDVKFNYEGIVGQSDAIKKVLNVIESVARTNTTTLLLGETGTGKELLARAIHNLSNRRERPMVKLNCTAIPAGLIEGELFGVEKGAYTGAESMRKGRFEIADQSTLFLDEIGEIPKDIQVKLLRVLESGEFERLGGSKTYQADVRIISATNRNLEKAVENGMFREDLYYRLNVFPIYIPPLRERKEDIPLLVWMFIEDFGNIMGKRIEAITPKSIADLQRYSFPGNIRELRNIIERAMIMSKGKSLNIQFPELHEKDPGSDLSLEHLERSHIIKVLEKTGWRIMGQSGAAERLGIKRTTLYSRMKKLGIRRNQ